MSEDVSYIFVRVYPAVDVLAQAVGNTTNKWANREMLIRAAREEQEFLDKIMFMSPPRYSSFQFPNTYETRRLAETSIWRYSSLLVYI